MMKRLQGKTLMVLAQTVPCGVVALQMLLGLQPARAGGEPSAAVPLNEIEPSVTTVEEWAAQLAQAELVEITNVRVEETADGFTLRLETTGELAVPETSITGNAIIADISNAVLNLAAGDEFFASDPAVGIALINVTNLPNNQVRIAITGTDAPPTINITTAAIGLTVSATPGNPTVQAPDDAIQIVVTGEQEGYLVPNASTATRTDTPLRDIPNSIQVIPRQVIEDQQAISIEEVLENSAGATYQGDSFGSGVEFNVRGFEAQVLRDGFTFPGSRGDFANPETANLERVEVLRGPASILYGQVDPGGVINLVTKQPLSEPYYNIQLQGGSRGFISPSIDLSGPLTEDGRLLYRLNALYRRVESFRDYADGNDLERFFIAPTLSYQISDSTDLTISLQYVEDSEPDERNFPGLGRDPAPVPRERVFSNPDDSQAQNYLNVGYTLEHRFSDNWQLRNRFVYTSTSNEQPSTAIPFILNPATGDLTRFFGLRDESSNNLSLNTNVQGRFDTGSVQHTLLFGVDLSRTEESDFGLFDIGNPSIINIFNPDYDAAAPPSNAPIPFGSDSTTDILGIYLQDQVDILDNLILVAGLRYDTVNQHTVTLPGFFGSGGETSQADEALTPRIGIVYQPINPISLYANYARSFTPSLATDVAGNPLPSEEGVGFEVGVRAEIIENRLSATLAYFDITKQNVATDDPTTNLPGSIATGEQRSRGIDFNLIGEILPGWNIIASYAYIDAEVTKDNTIPVGNRLNNTPEHSASLWTTYELQSGDLQGLGFGLGFNFVGERQDLLDTFDAGSYFVTNAAVFYRRDNWRVQLNIDNLFDVDYEEFVFSGAATNFGLGDPLTMRASVSYTF